MTPTNTAEVVAAAPMAMRLCLSLMTPGTLLHSHCGQERPFTITSADWTTLALGCNVFGTLGTS